MSKHKSKEEFWITEGIAYIRFNFRTMTALYSCREDPKDTEYDLYRDEDGNWQVCERPQTSRPKWHSWATAFPVWADKEELIEYAYQRYRG